VVFQPSEKTSWKRETQKLKEEDAWERVKGTLSKLPCGYETTKDEGVQEVTAIVRLQEEARGCFVRLPTGSEWACIKSFASKRLGVGTWIASLVQERWCDHSRKPRHGETVRLHSIEEEPMVYSSSTKPSSRIEEEKLPKLTTSRSEEMQAVLKTDGPSDLSPANWTGDPKAPLEKIQKGTQRPLPNGEECLKTAKQIIVELAVPPIEILKPVLTKPLDEGERPRLLSLEEVRWKSEYYQKSWEAYIRLGAAMDSRLTWAQMLKAWKTAREKVDPTYLPREYHQEFWKALRKRQSEEWDRLMREDIFEMRVRDKYADFKLTLLTMHNDDISDEECE
jgi:hypothetical protein